MPPPARKALRDRLPEGLARRHPTALAELERRDDGSDEYRDFATRVLRHGEAARAWKAALGAGHVDPAEAGRQGDAAYLRSALRHAQALRTIAAHMDQHPFHAHWAVNAALARTEEESGAFPPLDAATTSAVTPFASRSGTTRFLRHLASALEEAPLARARGSMHRSVAMALFYPKPIDQHSARADAVVNSLLFAAVAEARLFTRDRSCLREVGTTMPKNGRPMWRLAAALVNDALKLSPDSEEAPLTAKTAQDRLTVLLKRNRVDRNRGLEWAEWPPLPEGKHRRLARKKSPKRR